MIYEFGFKNYFGFREGVNVSFVLDNNCPENFRQGRSFTTVLAIKGANASGKTHILRSLSFICNLAANSFVAKPGSLIALESFFQSPEPSEFYIKFKTNNGNSYIYELSATEMAITGETLYRANSKKTKMIERKANLIVKKTREFDRIATIQLRPNASFISAAHQYGFDELNDVYDFFENVVTNVTYGGFREEPKDLELISEKLHNNPDILEFINKFIPTCDTGVSEVKIINRKGEGDQQIYYPMFKHKFQNNSHYIPSVWESSGTKTLLRELLGYKRMLNSGGLIIADEFGANLHPDILPKLLDLFLDKKQNPNEAQLLLATHDNDILDTLGRYRTYLTNKIGNESFAYRLDELPGDILRNDRPISPAYKAGKIGGVPKL